MQEFSAYIDFCAQQYYGIAKCQNCPHGQCIHENPGDTNADCYSCLYKIHRHTNHQWTYQCNKIIYNYILKHGHRYVSEIDKILALLKGWVALPMAMNVYSIGSGPCTELFGVINQFCGRNIHFRGFDLNTIWKPLNDFQKTLFPNIDIDFNAVDLFAYMSATDVHIDILILNYMLSDMARYESTATCNNFIENLVALCKAGRITYIVINDVYLTYSSGTGYSLMEQLAGRLRKELKEKEKEARGRFVEPNEWQAPYGKKYSEYLTFPVIEQSAIPFSPQTPCGSMFIIIETKP